MRRLYQQISGILDKVNFEMIWKGFHRFPFALYTNERIWLESEELPYDSRFLGNTSIEWEQGYMAIWNVNSLLEEDSEELAAGIVHEMFHAFQQESGEMRYPKELEMLNYPLIAENFGRKYYENRKLVEAYRSKDIQNKIKLLSLFFGSRMEREKIISKAINNEYLTETLEGMAEYTGLSALRQIEEYKYKNKLEEYLTRLENDKNLIFDIRRSCYYIGTILLLTLKDIGIDIYHRIGDVKEPIFVKFQKNFKFMEAPYEPDDEVLYLTELHFEKLQKQFSDYFMQPKVRLDAKGIICGYDPMNMMRYGHQIMCSRFVMILPERERTPIYIEGPVVVELEKGTDNITKYYYK